ncbi:type IX secretion system membrane protein PorP/SprF [Candidatus Poribacteria bacterium]|nr:type IX secretion system membrane protein PorP/SprF [Candidatus Poribacteria bacterium]
MNQENIDKFHFKVSIALGFLLMALIMPFSSYAAFVDRGGVRPMGMGGAFVALADDSSAVMFNPAGIGQLGRTEVAAAYDRLYAGLEDDSLGRGYISYTQPSGQYGAFAINLAMLNTPLYRETTISLGYGRTFGRVYLGVNAKGLFAGFDENDYTEIDPLFSESMTTNGIALDVGTLIKVTNNLSFGFALLNVNQPDMALDENAEDKVPMLLQAGTALRFGNITPVVDFTYRNKDVNDSKDINLNVGLESWLAGGSIGLRGGFNFHDMSLGASYIINRGGNTDAQIDYAFRYPLFFKEDSISDIYGTHQFSLNVRFDSFSRSSDLNIEDGDEDIAAIHEDIDESLQLAVEHKEAGRLGDALKVCEDILDPESGAELTAILDAHVIAADILFEMDRQDEALEHLMTAVRIAPKDPRIHYELAMLYKKKWESTGSRNWYNKAIIEMEKIRMIDEDFRDVKVQLANLKKEG